MALATNLGFPRIGGNRALKKALERYWAGDLEQPVLLETARQIRETNWRLQQQAGIEQIPSNDFSFYDQMLDTCAMVGAVQPRYRWDGGAVNLDLYFQMARGMEKQSARATIAMEMTKWFDTNYHYIVPEFHRGQRFELAWAKPVEEFKEAKALGIQTRPVLVGPVTFLLLGKTHENEFDRLELLDELLPVYAQVLSQLQDAGAAWVQLDEPCLALDLDEKARQTYAKAYQSLRQAAPKLKLLLATYFAGLREHTELAVGLPVDALHVDLVREPEQAETVAAAIGGEKILSAGVVDGRNVWRNDHAATLAVLEKLRAKLGNDRLWVAPSCSLLHVPIDLEMETDLPSNVADWLSFGKQKLDEIATLTRALNEGRHAVHDTLERNQAAHAARRESEHVHRPEVQQRVARIGADDTRRDSPFQQRQPLQHQVWNQPLLPTTTIGSFPQTPQIRQQRAQHRKGEITDQQYNEFLEQEVALCIRRQEAIGLDMLVHGEPERNDMVQYFGEKLSGLAFTQYAWVQSYGSRCVRPPIIYGDVERPEPMTVDWARYAQSLTDNPVKGMLTGPVTVLQWSFVRNDQPREKTCKQIALAIRDEVSDLEAAGIKAIQIDEPAIREGLPLRHADRDAYNKWAVEAFRLASACVKDETQIHTHMCYSEFNEMMDVIADMDADVISIEASRSQMELLNVFAENGYPNEVGPGVYDIHSPRVPTAEEMAENLRRALASPSRPG